MDGMLSQDEINALLSGIDTGNNDDTAPAASDASSDEELLSDIEKDAVGEIANISMGTSATTLYSLVNRKVNITTPRVSLATWDSIVEDYPTPCVFVQIKYTIGLNGSNILVLREEDVKIITDLMMGGDGTNIDGELGELHLSAISEAMNQMMGSAATSLSSMIGQKIDISPPSATHVNVNELKDAGVVQEFIDGTFVKIAFRMQIGDLIDSIIMQLYPLDFAHSLYDIFMNQQAAEEPAPEPAPAPAAAPAPAPQAAPVMEQAAVQQAPMGQEMSQQMMPQMGMQPMMMQGQPMPYMMPQMAAPMNVQSAQFQAFSPDMAAIIGQENINLIMDVPLEVTVELGRTVKTIHEILDFAPGTIIELEKLAGEPIDVLVNGKYVAKGEVVVIEESFGVRVTEIIKD
ncbi:MAG: flagellar motor switch phosphatase FliY [Lachnospiraceae bacterium]|nr:flagellar motor switch phosphatase FliY [Lachnospiraceae bacterium]